MGRSGVLPGPIEVRERDLLGRLGLDERATTEDIARTRDELQSFLATAPRSIRGWARTQATAADEAFALLSDPTARHDAGALPTSRSRSAAQPDGPATPPVRRAIPAADPAPMPSVAPEGDEDETFEAMLAELTPSMHRDRLAKPGTAWAAAAVSYGATSSRRFPRALAIAAGLVAVAAAVVIGVYQLGVPAVASAPSVSPAPTSGLDQARVAELMGRIQTDPKDTAALLELGDLFFQAGDYSAAVTWLDKLVALEPNNVRGRLALGAAQFNLGDVETAETHWTEVLKVDPDNVEAHYDLGFLYLNQAPPDLDGVQREWAEVVRLAPNTEIAKVVQQHLDALATASFAPSAGASAAPGTDASAAPSSIPSEAPSVAPSGASSSAPSTEPGESTQP